MGPVTQELEGVTFLFFSYPFILVLLQDIG
jgi:hypothetical protein